MSQSQGSLLEEVVGWNPSQCKENWTHTLPKLISCFTEAQVLQEQVGVLKIICQLFLPHVEIVTAEEKVFSSIVSQACATFDKILADICQQVQSDSWNPQNTGFDVASFLGLLQDVVDCCELCVKHVCREDLKLEWSQVHSLPHGTVHLLKGAYGHCKESGDLYGNFMSIVSEPLSALFKKAHSLQQAFLKLLDHICIGISPTENDVQDLCLVCHGLFEVCQIVTSLDMKLVVTLWKAISRHVVQNKDHLYDRLEVESMVRYLCKEIQTGFTYLFQLLPYLDADGVALSQGDEKGFQKSVRILGFQMKIVVMFVREFVDYLRDCGPEVYDLMIHLYRLTPPSLQARKLQQHHKAEIDQQLLNACNTLVMSLLPNRKFMTCITGSEAVKKLTDEACFPHLLLVITTLDSLPKTTSEVSNAWISPSALTEDKTRHSILQSVFSLLRKCFVEVRLPVSLPGLMCSGKPQRDISLYEKVCTHLCGFIGSLPSAHFHTLEKIQLENLLSCDSMCSCLAADAWCFMTRYGTADLCHKHVSFLMQLIGMTCGFSVQHSNIVSLVNRLLKSLAQEHQSMVRLSSSESISLLSETDDKVNKPALLSIGNSTEVAMISERADIVKTFPIASNFSRWSQLSISCFTSSTLNEMTESMIGQSVNMMDEFIGAREKRQQDFLKLSSCLTYLTNTLGNAEIVQRNIPASTQSVILRKTCQLWASIHVSDWTGIPLTELCLGQLIQHTANMATMFNGSELIKVFTVMLSILQQNASQYLKLSMVQFLGKFGKVKISASFEQPQTLNKVSESFTKLLSDQDVVIHHKSVEAFTRFAQETIHEAIVPECISRDQRLQDCVVMYLNRTPYEANNTQSRLDHLQQQKRHKDLKVPRSDSDPTFEPCSKRQKLDMSEDTVKKMPIIDVQDLIVTMETCIRQLKEWSHQTNELLPGELKDKMGKVHKSIGLLIQENG